jgi:hypothetical protein
MLCSRPKLPDPAGSMALLAQNVFRPGAWPPRHAAIRRHLLAIASIVPMRRAAGMTMRGSEVSTKSRHVWRYEVLAVIAGGTRRPSPHRGVEDDLVTAIG